MALNEMFQLDRPCYSVSGLVLPFCTRRLFDIRHGRSVHEVTADRIKEDAGPAVTLNGVFYNRIPLAFNNARGVLSVGGRGKAVIPVQKRTGSEKALRCFVG